MRNFGLLLSLLAPEVLWAADASVCAAIMAEVREKLDVVSISALADWHIDHGDSALGEFIQRDLSLKSLKRNEVRMARDRILAAHRQRWFPGVPLDFDIPFDRGLVNFAAFEPEPFLNHWKTLVWHSIDFNWSTLRKVFRKIPINELSRLRGPFHEMLHNEQLAEFIGGPPPALDGDVTVLSPLIGKQLKYQAYADGERGEDGLGTAIAKWKYNSKRYELNVSRGYADEVNLELKEENTYDFEPYNENLYVGHVSSVWAYYDSKKRFRRYYLSDAEYGFANTPIPPSGYLELITNL